MLSNNRNHVFCYDLFSFELIYVCNPFLQESVIDVDPGMTVMLVIVISDISSYM